MTNMSVDYNKLLAAKKAVATIDRPPQEPMTDFKLLIVGNHGCGKDVAAMAIAEAIGLTYTGSLSSSTWLQTFYKILDRVGVNVPCTLGEFIQLRHNYSGYLTAMFTELRRIDPLELLRQHKGQIVTGVRSVAELNWFLDNDVPILHIDRDGCPDDPTIEYCLNSLGRSTTHYTYIRNAKSLDKFILDVSNIALNNEEAWS